MNALQRVLDLRATESKNKHPWVSTTANLEFNPWKNSDRHSLGKERGKSPSLLLPPMSVLHFKGMASPTCHTLVNSLILTWFELQHQLLCKRTVKCLVAGWWRCDELSRKKSGKEGRWRDDQSATAARNDAESLVQMSRGDYQLVGASGTKSVSWLC